MLRGRYAVSGLFAVVVVGVAFSVVHARLHAPSLQAERGSARQGAGPRPELPGVGTTVGPRRPRVAFRYEAGGVVTSPVALDPQGRIYLTSHDGRLHALDADGSLRFTRPLAPSASTGGSPLPPAWGGPFIDAEGRVWVGSDAGVLHVFSLDGDLLRTVPLPGPIDRAPVGWAGRGVIVTGGRTVTAFGADLKTRFRFEAWAKVFARPAVDPHGNVYVAAQDDFLHSLDPVGEVRFRGRAQGDLDGSPVWTPGRVMVGSDDGRLYGFSDRDGATVWTAQLGGYVRAPLAMAGEWVVAATHGPTPRVVALHVRDGRVGWSFSPGRVDSSERGFRGGACIDARGQVYVGGQDQLYALSPDGSLRFSHPVRGEVRSSPVLRADGTLIFGTQAGLVYGLRD